MPDPRDNLCHRGRAFSGADRASTVAEGVIVSVCAEPTYTIRTADGEHVHWAASLTEVGEEVPAPDVPLAKWATPVGHPGWCLLPPGHTDPCLPNLRYRYYADSRMFTVSNELMMRYRDAEREARHAAAHPHQHGLTAAYHRMREVSEQIEALSDREHAVRLTRMRWVSNLAQHGGWPVASVLRLHHPLGSEAICAECADVADGGEPTYRPWPCATVHTVADALDLPDPASPVDTEVPADG